MDHIRESNLLISAFIEAHYPSTPWLDAQTYEETALAVVMSSLKKKFEEPNDTTAANRRISAVKEFLLRNQNTLTDTQYCRRLLAKSPGGFKARTLMNQLNQVMKGWFRGATFALNDGWVGPGESFISRHGFTSALNKLEIIECTPRAASLVRKWLRRDQIRSQFDKKVDIRLIPGNRLTSVRKNNQKDRAICIEGVGNMIIQKAIGQMFRRTYHKVFGRELDYAQDYHSEIVIKGGVTTSRGVTQVTTIDLSAASDSISMLLCSEVLPPWIYQLIVDSRSEYVQYEDEDGETRLDQLRIVSSMGNGFTFELLTLLCAAICEVSGCSFYSTYGDDIIVDRDKAPLVIENLELLGFKVNVDKTCHGIPQLESCGAFSFDGIEIRRYEVEWMVGPQDVCSVMNKILDMHDFYNGLVDDLAERLKGLWLKLYAINKDMLAFGPNHNRMVDGTYARIPHELIPSHLRALPTWCMAVARFLQKDPNDFMLVETYEFKSEVTVVRKPDNGPNYMLVRYRSMTAPAVYKRGKGQWVRRLVLFSKSESNFRMSRKEWDVLTVPEKVSGSDVAVKGRSGAYSNGLNKPLHKPVIP